MNGNDMDKMETFYENSNALNNLITGLKEYIMVKTQAAPNSNNLLDAATNYFLALQGITQPISTIKILLSESDSQGMEDTCTTFDNDGVMTNINPKIMKHLDDVKSSKSHVPNLEAVEISHIEADPITPSASYHVEESICKSNSTDLAKKSSKMSVFLSKFLCGYTSAIKMSPRISRHDASVPEEPSSSSSSTITKGKSRFVLRKLSGLVRRKRTSLSKVSEDSNQEIVIRIPASSSSSSSCDVKLKENISSTSEIIAEEPEENLGSAGFKEDGEEEEQISTPTTGTGSRTIMDEELCHTLSTTFIDHHEEVTATQTAVNDPVEAEPEADDHQEIDQPTVLDDHEHEILNGDSSLTMTHQHSDDIDTRSSSICRTKSVAFGLSFSSAEVEKWDDSVSPSINQLQVAFKDAFEAYVKENEDCEHLSSSISTPSVTFNFTEEPGPSPSPTTHGYTIDVSPSSSIMNEELDHTHSTSETYINRDIDQGEEVTLTHISDHSGAEADKHRDLDEIDTNSFISRTKSVAFRLPFGSTQVEKSESLASINEVASEDAFEANVKENGDDDNVSHSTVTFGVITEELGLTTDTNTIVIDEEVTSNPGSGRPTEDAGNWYQLEEVEQFHSKTQDVTQLDERDNGDCSSDSTVTRTVSPILYQETFLKAKVSPIENTREIEADDSKSTVSPATVLGWGESLLDKYCY
ncbi:hypothetical protein ACHWQZ_G008076 [Mnemiopsis leidyi]